MKGMNHSYPLNMYRYYLYKVFMIFFSKNTSDVETTMALNAVQFAFCGCVPLISSYWNAKYLSDFLNNGISYANNFVTQFPLHGSEYTYLVLKALATKKLTVIVLVLSIGTIWFPFIFPQCFRQLHDCSQSDYQVSYISLYFTSLSFWVIALELFKLEIFTKVVIGSFNQIKEILDNQTKYSDGQSLSLKLQSLLSFTRRQFRLLRKLCSPFQIALAGIFFTSSIVTWILCIYCLIGQTPLIIVGFSLTFLSLQGTVLFSIAVLSEQIIKVETNCVKLLLELQLVSRKQMVEVCCQYIVPV